MFQASRSSSSSTSPADRPSPVFAWARPRRMPTICGVAGTGRSSSAEAAAKAIAACTSSVFRAGKAARIVSTESLAAKLANTVRSVTRVPRKTGSPPQIFPSLTILSSCFTSGYPFPKLLGHLLNEHHTIGTGAGGFWVEDGSRGPGMRNIWRLGICCESPSSTVTFRPALRNFRRHRAGTSGVSWTGCANFSPQRHRVTEKHCRFERHGFRRIVLGMITSLPCELSGAQLRPKLAPRR
jgi:hypothetical protein